MNSRHRQGKRRITLEAEQAHDAAAFVQALEKSPVDVPLVVRLAAPGPKKNPRGAGRGGVELACVGLKQCAVTFTS